MHVYVSVKVLPNYFIFHSSITIALSVDGDCVHITYNYVDILPCIAFRSVVYNNSVPRGTGYSGTGLGVARGATQDHSLS